MLRHIPELRSAEISGTPIHPVWSLDANDWIQLSELKTGEQLKTRAGAVSIAAIETHHWSQAVYNIEVHTEHVYEIGESGILVHNAKGDSCKLGRALKKSGEARPPDKIQQGSRLVSEFQAAHIVPSSGWANRVGHIQDLLRNNNLMNAADNGFWAKAGHLGTHTNEYIDDVVEAFRNVDNAAGAKVALANLKAKIKSGAYGN